MKTAYELAMERLNKTAPAVKLTNDQKKRMAELDAQYKARIADREIFLGGKLEQARAAEDFAAIEQFEKQLASDRKSLKAELEEKKEKIRQEG
jgi:hypothetical protein